MTNDKSPNIWMPFYIGDYLADTMHLTQSQHGAYLLLIMHYWVTGKALPNDDEILRNISKSSPQFWKKFRPVALKFFIEKDELLYHSRIEEEITKALENKENQRKRTEKARQKKAEAHTVTKVVTDIVTASPSPSPSPSPLSPPPPKGNLNSFSNGGNGNGKCAYQLEPQTYDKARQRAPGYDIYFLEQQWREFTGANKLENPDGAFIKFCETHKNNNPL